MCVLAAHVNEIRVVTYSSYLGYKFYCYKVVWVMYFSIGYGPSDFFSGLQRYITSFVGLELGLLKLDWSCLSHAKVNWMNDWAAIINLSYELEYQKLVSKVHFLVINLFDNIWYFGL